MRNVLASETTSLESIGILQPLHIPEAIWLEISVDFVTGLPTIYGYSVIIVVANVLSKYYYLGSLLATNLVVSIADYFINLPDFMACRLSSFSTVTRYLSISFGRSCTTIVEQSLVSPLPTI